MKVRIAENEVMFRAAKPRLGRQDRSGAPPSEFMEGIPTEQARLLGRMDDIRSMLRDAKPLDVVETLRSMLADCEQRLIWVEGENLPAEPASA